MILFFFCVTVMGMKRYKPLLLQVGILLLILSTALFVLEQRKQFVSIDFSKRYQQNKTIELSGFEEGERWQGNYSYDSVRVFEGNSSITLSSWYGKENSIQKNQDTTLPQGYTNGYVSLYVADKQNLSSIVSISLKLVGEKNQEKEYVLAPMVQLGWNRIAIPMPSWKKITGESFSILSKPETIAEVNLDRFWIENASVYISDIFSTRNQSLSLRTIGDRTYLFSSSPLLESYIFNTPSMIKKGFITVSLIPEHVKEMLLSLNGTSMKITGENMDECFLNKNDDKPIKKVLKKTAGKNNLYVFMKADIQNGTVVYSLSNNGVDFESCGTVTSSRIQPIQLSLQGSCLIDSYSAEY